VGVLMHKVEVGVEEVGGGCICSMENKSGNIVGGVRGSLVITNIFRME